jgi:hypothetical protein
MKNDDSVNNRYKESHQRFDYFMTGLATAVLAYAVQSFDAGSYYISKWLAPIAWLLFLVAVLTGIRRLHYNVAIAKNESEHDNIWLQMKNYQGIATRLKRGTDPRNEINMNVYPFRPYTNDEAESLAKDYEHNLMVNDNEKKRITARSEFMSGARQWFLMLGLLVLGILKALNL